MAKTTTTIRRFVAISAAALGSLALTGCAGKSEQAAPAAASDSQSSEAAAQTESAASEPAPEPEPEPTPRILVTVFSATGHTRAIAEIAAAYLDADYAEIEPAVPYVEEDLNYDDRSTRATYEQDYPSTRPELAAIPDFDSYDTILLGHPIWWGKAPRLICTLLESVDLSGKSVAEFVTSSSSGVEDANAEVVELAPEANWLDARRFAAGASESEVNK